MTFKGSETMHYVLSVDIEKLLVLCEQKVMSEILSVGLACSGWICRVVDLSYLFLIFFWADTCFFPF